MVDELTTTGLEIDDYTTRRADVVADLRSVISSILDVSPDQPIGQKTDIYLERLQAAMEILQEVHAAFDPAQATGLTLDGVCSILGTYRNPATKGTVTLKLTLNATTTVPAGSQAAVSGDANNIWVTDEAVTSVGAGDYTVGATALTAGVYPAVSSSITTIVTAVAGWTAVTNDADATPGEARETDADLRVRRNSELSLGGSTSVDAIRAEVSEITWVEDVIVYENDSIRSVAPMPPKSIETVIRKTAVLTAAQVAELGALLLTEVAAGIQAYGSDIGDGSGDESTPIEDDRDNIHAIGWTRASEQTVHIEVDISTAGDYDADTYEGDAALKAAIVAWGEDLEIGEDVVFFKLVQTVMDQTGIENATSILVDTVDPPVGTSDIPIGAREVALISTANIDVVS